MIAGGGNINSVTAVLGARLDSDIVENISFRLSHLQVLEKGESRKVSVSYQCLTLVESLYYSPANFPYRGWGTGH